MKKLIGISVLSMVVLCISAADLEARGGRGGGGGRSDAVQRGSHGGAAAARSHQPAAVHGQAINRQHGVQQPAVQRHQGVNPHAAAVRSRSRAVRSGAAAHHAGRRDIRRFLNVPSGAVGYPIAGRGGGLHNINRSRINHNFAGRYARYAHRPFYPAWYATHAPAHWRYWHYGRYRPGYWWGWATAGMITGWIVYDWPTPYYYYYGTGGNVYYVGDQVYINGQPAYSGEEYYQQAATIAENVPELDEQQAEKIEWMPLGVFAVVPENTEDANLILQMAVSKDGMISGTMLNESTKLTNAVEGSVDKKTQRAAWSFLDGENNVIMETGIYNLSKDETNVLVHLGPKDTKIWSLVRLEKPADGDATGATSTDPSTIVAPKAETGPEIVPNVPPQIPDAAETEGE